MLVLHLRCATCGAAGGHAEGALFAACAYCGAILGQGRDAMDRAVEAVREAYLAIAAPTAVARTTTLRAATYAAHAAGDRAAWRRAATELRLLEVGADPARVPPWASRDLAGWLRGAIAVDELITFDAALTSSYPQLPVAALQATPADAARTHLAALRAWHQRLLDHPEFPVEQRGRLAVDALAADGLRVALAAAAPMLGEHALTAAHVAALGATWGEEGHCPTCGGPHEARDVRAGACPWCRAVIDRDLAHPWVLGLARHAGVALLGRAELVDRASVVAQLVLANAALAGVAPTAARVHALLAMVLPTLTPAALADALAPLRHSDLARWMGPFDELLAGVR